MDLMNLLSACALVGIFILSSFFLKPFTVEQAQNKIIVAVSNIYFMMILLPNYQNKNLL